VHRVAAGQRARQRRREDRNAGNRLVGAAEIQEAGTGLDERPKAGEARADGDAEEPFKAVAAKRYAVGREVARLPGQVGIDANEGRRLPRQAAAAADIGAFDVAELRGRQVHRGLEGLSVRAIQG
jgi:hypothetical protein